MKTKLLYKAALALCAALLPLCAAAQTLRGDVNKDGKVDVSDATILIGYILNGTPSLDPNAANVDHSGGIDVADVTFLIDLILNGGTTVGVRTFTVNGVSFSMVRVEPGTFIMGADGNPGEGRPSCSPAHPVTLTKAYYVGQTEVTQELWLAVMGSNPSAYNEDPQTPVNMVSPMMCSWFCDKLTDMTGMDFRMLTEAEWEFAARGGNLSRGYLYAGGNNIDEVAWYSGNKGGVDLHRVGTKAPNELGIYDMTGNADEWVQDYSYSYVASQEPLIDPCNTEYFSRKIVRGGHSGIYDYNGYVVRRDWAAESEIGVMRTLRLAYTAK